MLTPAETTQARLDDQIEWYDRKSQSNQRWFKVLKILEIAAAVFITPFAMLMTNGWPTVSLGVIIIFTESFQHLNQYHHNWMAYRSTCEALKHEKYLYLAKAGEYRTIENPETLLAEKIETLISQEHTRWTFSRERAMRDKPSSNS